MSRLYAFSLKWGCLLTLSFATISLCSNCRVKKEQLHRALRGKKISQSTDPDRVCSTLYATVCYTYLNKRFHSHLLCSIVEGRQIVFRVKSSFGMTILEGAIDRKGITIVDRLHRSVYKFDHTEIRQRYQLPCDYASIEFLLLSQLNGILDQSAQAKHLADILSEPYVSCSYNQQTNKLESIKLCDTYGINHLVCTYQRKKASVCHKGCFNLLGINIHFLLNHMDKRYQGSLSMRHISYKRTRCAPRPLMIPPGWRRPKPNR